MFLHRLAVDANALDQDGLEPRVFVMVLAQPTVPGLRSIKLPSDVHAL
jgi:hypothetical protein